MRLAIRIDRARRSRLIANQPAILRNALYGALRGDVARRRLPVRRDTGDQVPPGRQRNGGR